MKRVKETKLKLEKKEANIVGHLCYAAFKLWNILNYERLHYEELGLKEYPDWYYQKNKHKDNFFARNLPSQTAQEVAKLLDKSWKSYFALLKSGGINNPPIFRTCYIENKIKTSFESFKRGFFRKMIN